ncbi:hypothetical protein MY092_001335 [Salmonella enterica]|uniref:hypothetical protein n=1 Tax=Salmonella enterica TaxID=28901 RepID=UPI001CBB4DB8|nr:hypothetical protein [Salmonella enterica]EHW7940165.1 hypothetical protein [Salmonella enterica]EJC4644051.1 hypothetical protein [Salmonella enterica]EKQ9925260.1 hypothetical protein [Salmonella enterica subsp. enterica serovar Panama]
MGVYRWYLLFSLVVFSSISHAADCPAGVHVPAGTYKPYYNVANSSGTFDHFINLGGCEYSSPSGGAESSDGSYASYGDFVSTGKPAKEGSPISSPQTTDTNPDDGDDNPDITPPVNPPVKPPVLPDSSSVRQLYDQYNNCTSQLNSYPMSDYDDYNPTVDYNYNAQVRQCNSILDRLTSLIKSNSINGATDAYNFLTGNGSGGFYICKQNPYTPQEWADMGKLYPGPVLGYQLNKLSEREIGFNCHIVHDSSDGKDKNHCSFHLNFNYTKDNGNGISVCNSVYTSSLNPGESGGSGGGSHEGSCPAGQFNIPGQGCMTVQCPAGSHPVAGATSSDAPTCETDTGSSGGDTGSGDDSGPGLSTPSLDVPDLTLAPLWNIWPSARDFKLTLPAAQCPVFNIEVFGTTHKIDTFCTLFTPDIIAIIRAICILTASIISFVIVLRS